MPMDESRSGVPLSRVHRPEVDRPSTATEREPAMSVGPPDEIVDTGPGPDDAAEPTRPSERSAWREPSDDNEHPHPGELVPPES